jgi:hypothetical protein
MSLSNFSDREAVSVIVVNYNAGALLTSCLNHVLHRVRQVIVVDNGSNDSSIDKLPDELARSETLKIIRVNQNRGYSAACNIGLNAATEPFILFLNPDCLLTETSLHQLMNVMTSDEQIGMVGGRLINPDGTEQRGARRSVPTPWRAFVRAFGLHRFADRWPRLFADFNHHGRSLPDAPAVVEAISGAQMLVRKKAIEDVGFWDEGYFLHCEDLDMCMRFRQREWKIVFVPYVSLVHYQGTCSQRRPFFVEWHKHKGMIRFYRKFFHHQYPGLLFWLVTAGVWLRFGAVVVMTGWKRFRQGFTK